MTRDIQRKETRWEREEAHVKEIKNRIEGLNFLEDIFVNMSDEQYDEYYVRRKVYKCSRKVALATALVY